jgi:hypothetical protein
MGKLQTHNIVKDAKVPQLVDFYEQKKFDRVTKLRAKFESQVLITIANELYMKEAPTCMVIHTFVLIMHAS